MSIYDNGPSGQSGYGFTFGNTGQFQPPRKVRFDVVGEAWRLFSQQTGTWVLASLVFFVIASALIVPLMAVLFAPMFAKIMSGSVTGRPTDPAQSPEMLIWVLVAPFLMCVVAAYFQGGLNAMAVKQTRGEQISVGDMFSRGPVAGNLVMIGLVTGAISAGFSLITLPIQRYGGSILDSIGTVAVTTLICLAPVIAVDRRESAAASLRASVEAIGPNFLNALLLYLVLQLISGLGGLLCGIGLLFTYPLSVIGIGLVYRDLLLDGPLPPGYPGEPVTGLANPWVPQQPSTSGLETPGGVQPEPGSFPAPDPGQYPPSAPPPPPSGDDLR